MTSPPPRDREDPSAGSRAAASGVPVHGTHPTAAARPTALLAVRITPDDVGSRVTVRHALHGDPTASLTDVVGTLLSWEPAAGPDAVLRIERRDGTTVAVPLPDIVAAKVVPPRRPR